MSDRQRPAKPVHPKEQIAAEDSNEVVEGVFKFVVPQDRFTAPGDVAGVTGRAAAPEEIEKLGLLDEPVKDAVWPKEHLLGGREEAGTLKEALLDRLDGADDQKLDGLDLHGIVSPRDPASGLPTGKLDEMDDSDGLAVEPKWIAPGHDHVLFGEDLTMDVDGQKLDGLDLDDRSEVVEGVFKFAVPVAQPGDAHVAHPGDADSGLNWNFENGWPAKVEADDADGGFAATASDPDNGDAVFKDVLLDQVDQFTNGKLKWELADAVHADVEGMSDADTDADLPDMPDEGYEEIVFTVVDVDADAADGYQAMPELDANALDTVSAIDDVDDLEDFDG